MLLFPALPGQLGFDEGADLDAEDFQAVDVGKVDGNVAEVEIMKNRGAQIDVLKDGARQIDIAKKRAGQRYETVLSNLRVKPSCSKWRSVVSASWIPCRFINTKLTASHRE